MYSDNFDYLPRKITSSILPVIGLFTGAAFRLIPSASKVFHSIQTLRFNETSVNIIHNDIVNSNKKDIESNFRKFL